MFTSMKEPRVLSVGLCVIRNLMFLWHSSTGAGRFMVATGLSEVSAPAVYHYYYYSQANCQPGICNADYICRLFLENLREHSDSLHLA